MDANSKQILKAPAFDLAFLDDASSSKPKAQDGSYCPDPIILAPGGGGSTKSGVKNQVQLLRQLDDLSCVYYKGFETDAADAKGTGICTGVCSGILQDKNKIIATLIDDKCLLSKVKRNPTFKKPLAAVPSSSNRKGKGGQPAYVSSRAPLPNSGLTFEEIATFQADFTENKSDAGAKCCSISTVNTIACDGDSCTRISQDLLAIGGEDGGVRIWSITPKAADVSSYDINLLSTFKGHTSAVTSVHFHPNRPWVVSASKDGSCRIYDVYASDSDSDSCLLHLPFVTNDLPGKNAKGGQGQCRGCIFSTGIDQPESLPPTKGGGETEVYYVYTVQCGRTGPTHLIKWKVICDSVYANGKDDSKDRVIVQSTMETSVSVCDGPCTRLDVSPSGLFVAVGCSDGATVVFTCVNLSRYGRYLCHDLSVTGMAFAPEAIALQTGVPDVLASCSADNRLALIPLGGISPWFQFFSTAVMILIITLLTIVSAALLSGMVTPKMFII